MNNIFFNQYLKEGFDTKALAARRKELIANYDRPPPKDEVVITKETTQMLVKIRNDLGLYNNKESSPVWLGFIAALMNQKKSNPKFVKRILADENTAKRFVVSYINKFRRDIESTSEYLSEKKS